MLFDILNKFVTMILWNYMKESLLHLSEQAKKIISEAKDLETLREISIRLLGRKHGELTHLLSQLKDLPQDQKKSIGLLANQIKSDIEQLLIKRKNELTSSSVKSELVKEAIDITEPSLPKKESGHMHPISIIQYELEDIFTSMGFIIADGPELESEYYNFEALNIPRDHPARDIQDTFYIKDHPGLLMRTHTSPVQVRMLEKYGAPLRVVAPGRVFRNEATDASHEHTFYQLEGLVVDKEISIGHMLGVMKEMLKEVFKREVEVRLRPGYFPFVEPGFELDIRCLICHGKGCGVCKYQGWVESVGCGLVHPEVLTFGGLDPKQWTGFAFGWGLTRLAMMRYGISDVRLFFKNDLRFLFQF